MKRALFRIESWIRLNAASHVSLFSEGASENEIESSERTIGITFPRSIRLFYSMHDGSNRIWICEKGYIMPLNTPVGITKRRSYSYNSVVKRWTLLKELLDDGSFVGRGFQSVPKGPIRTDHWNSSWIPITDNENGDHLCLDMAPAKGGKIGQIIEWDHEIGAKCVVAASFQVWLEQLADGIEMGQYRYDVKNRAIVCK